MPFGLDDALMLLSATGALGGLFGGGRKSRTEVQLSPEQQALLQWALKMMPFRAGVGRATAGGLMQQQIPMQRRMMGRQEDLWNRLMDMAGGGQSPSFDLAGRLPSKFPRPKIGSSMGQFGAYGGLSGRLGGRPGGSARAGGTTATPRRLMGGFG